MDENELEAVEFLRHRLSQLNQYVNELVQTPQQSEFLSQTFAELYSHLTRLEMVQKENNLQERALKVLAEHSPQIITRFDDEQRMLNEDGTLSWVDRVLENVTQKQQMESTLQYRVAFETLLTQISTQFINLTSDEIDQGINQAIKAIGEFTFVERVYVYSSDGKQMSLTHDWCATDFISASNNDPEIPRDTFLWLSPQLRQFKTVHIPDVDDLPSAAEAEKLVLQAFDVRTFVAVPLVYDSVLIGTLCFNSINRTKIWSEEDITLMSTLGDIFANAFARKYVESTIRENEERFRQLADNIDEVFWIRCLESNRIIYISPAYEKIWGRSCRSVYENTFTWIDTLYPEELDRLSVYIEAWHRGEHFNNIEYRIVRPDGEIRWISDRAFPIRNQQGVVYRYAGISEDISERKLASEQLQASLIEKEVLLQEIHHRVKNNLQIISSLLYLQANRIENDQAREFLQDSRSRIESMALVHETLYIAHNFAGINFAEYVQNLVANLFQMYKNSTLTISLRVNVAPDILINLDQAIPCGLIVNELITNALKHSFKITQEGEVFVTLEANPNQQLILTVGNNGDNLPPNFELQRTQSMGLRLVMTLVRQLQGTVEVERNNPTAFKIIFPNLG